MVHRCKPVGTDNTQLQRDIRESRADRISYPLWRVSHWTPQPLCIHAQFQYPDLYLRTPYSGKSDDQPETPNAPSFHVLCCILHFPRFRRGLQPSVESEKTFVGVKLGIVPCSDTSPARYLDMLFCYDIWGT